MKELLTKALKRRYIYSNNDGRSYSTEELFHVDKDELIDIHNSLMGNIELKPPSDFSQQMLVEKMNIVDYVIKIVDEEGIKKAAIDYYRKLEESIDFILDSQKISDNNKTYNAPSLNVSGLVEFKKDVHNLYLVLIDN